MRTQLAVVAAALALGGCAFKQMDAAQKAAESKPVTCAVGPECDLMWTRVAEALRHYTPHGLRDETTDRINNNLPRSSHMTPWFRVRKINRGDGTAEIKIEAGCMNVFGCSPDVSTVAERVTQYVITGKR